MANDYELRTQAVQDLLNEALIVASDLELNYDSSNGENMSGLLETLQAHLGRIPHLIADAEYYLTLRRAEITDELSEKKVQATYMREIVAGKTVLEQKAVTFIDRLYSALKIKIDVVRSALSFLKMEMQQYGNGKNDPGEREPFAPDEVHQGGR